MDVLDLQFGRSIIPFSQFGILTYKFLALNKINFNLIYFFIISILFTRRIEYGHDFCYRFFSFLFLYHFSTRNACCISCWFYDKWGIVCGSWNVKNDVFNKRKSNRSRKTKASLQLIPGDTITPFWVQSTANVPKSGYDGRGWNSIDLCTYIQQQQRKASSTIDVIPSFNKDTIMTKWNSSFFLLVLQFHHFEML